MRPDSQSTEDKSSEVDEAGVPPGNPPPQEGAIPDPPEEEPPQVDPPQEAYPDLAPGAGISPGDFITLQEQCLAIIASLRQTKRQLSKLSKEYKELRNKRDEADN